MKRLFLILTLVLALGAALNAEQVTVGGYQNEITLLESSPSHMVMQMTLGHFDSEPVQIDGDTWHHLSLKKEGLTLEAGYPQVPVLARSVIIPNTAQMELNLVDSEYVELELPVAPSKGNLTRDIDPASVPYTFNEFYSGEGSWPQETSYLTEPFILRDYRGITVRFQPFVYYPASGILRVYTRLRLSLDAVGTDYTNSLAVPKTAYAPEFEGIYENMFLNFGDAKYPSLAEEGRILAIKHETFDDAMQPWVEWKRQKGYRVDIVDVSVAGPTANQILAYIQGQYDLDDGLMFVQIFGDAPQVPTLTFGSGGSDPSYSLLAGTDSYPDIYVGRFSAQTVEEMQTQIERTVWYERDIQSGSAWLAQGMGIASSQGGGSQGDMGESDITHMNLIRDDLLGYGYTSVDQIYDPSASASQVTTNLNAGRGIINYCGHGSTTSWGTTGFSNTNVNALTNDFLLPHIFSVACLNGNFVSGTCFAEAWLRATNNATDDPTGAIAMYASTVNQSWDPPMRAQDEAVDLLVAEAKHTIGGLWFNGSSRMMEVYPDGIQEFKNWHIFGDASLLVRSADPTELTATYNPVLFLGMSSFQVETEPGARVALYGDGTLYGTGIVDPSGVIVLNIANPPMQPMDLTLTVTALNKVTHIGTVQALPASGPYVIINDMVITDDNNGIPEFGETINLNFEFDNVGNDPAQNVEVTLTTDDPYITILNPTEIIQSIAANGTASTVDGFDIQIATNIPDQHSPTVQVSIDVGTEVFEYSRGFVVNAPAFTWGGIMVDDFLGNNNGMIDPGESVTLTFPFTNSGHAQASDITTFMVINNGTHVAEEIQTSFTALPPGGEGQMVYFVTFSSQIPAGTVVNISCMLFTGDYSSTHTYAVTLGIVAENFESGFSSFPWEFTGGDWTIDQQSYNNTNSARSAAITHNETTSMTVTLSSDAPGTISFWKKVSSEQNYDNLRFYINGIMKNQWSGTSDVWSQVNYDVQAGMNIYKWEYSKDSMVSSGSDCAWIDDIVFPTTGGTTGAPAISLDQTSLDFGETLIGETQTLPFTVHNNGDAVLIGTVEVEEPFCVYQGNGTPGSVISIVVDAGSFLTYNVCFTPLDETDYTADMVLSTDDPANPQMTVQLSGTGQPLANDDPVMPAVTELKGNFPNPFNPVTTILYSVKEATPVSIGIYNVKGQLVRTLVQDEKAAGNYEAVFDGLDDNRAPLSSGVYFYRMRAGDYTGTRRMIMLK